MSKLLWLVVLVCSAIARPSFGGVVTINAFGQGPSQSAAIDAAKQQAIRDSVGAYVSTGTKDGRVRSVVPSVERWRVIEVQEVGPSLYEAEVEAKIAVITSMTDEPHVRVAFVQEPIGSSANSTDALITALEKELSSSRRIETVDDRDPAVMRLIERLKRGQRSPSGDLSHPTRNLQLDILFLISVDDSHLPAGELKTKIYVVDGSSAQIRQIKTIRSIAPTGVSEIGPLAITDAASRVANVVSAYVATHLTKDGTTNVITIPTNGVKLNVGQAVVVYRLVKTMTEGQTTRKLVATTGQVITTGRTSVEVLTEDFVSSSDQYSVKPATSTKRGVVITESDW